MPLGGSSKPKKANQVSSVSDEPEDASALWIMYMGREWIVLYNEQCYTAFPADNRTVTKKHLDKLFSYLKSEGFIDERNKPKHNNDNSEN